MPATERLLVRRAFLAGVGQVAAGPTQQRVLTPWLAKDCNAAWPQDAEEFPAGNLDIQMMQDGVAPDAIEGLVGERESLAVGLHELNLYTIRLSPPAGFFQVAGREIKRSDVGSLPCESHRCHAVAAAVIQHAGAADVAKLLKGRPDPGFVVQVGCVLE